LGFAFGSTTYAGDTVLAEISVPVLVPWSLPAMASGET